MILFWKKEKENPEIAKLKGDIEILKKQCAQYRLDLDALDRVLKEQDISTAKEINEFKISVNNEVVMLKREVGEIVFNMKNEVTKKLLEFEKEITGKIADRYFKTLEDIFRWMREFSFLEKYVSGDSKTLTDLRKTILQPFLDVKASEEMKLKGAELENSIKSHGQVILEKRKKLWEEKLQLERLEQDAREVNAQIRMIDFIIGGAK